MGRVAPRSQFPARGVRARPSKPRARPRWRCPRSGAAAPRSGVVARWRRGRRDRFPLSGRGRHRLRRARSPPAGVDVRVEALDPGAVVRPRGEPRLSADEAASAGTGRGRARSGGRACGRRVHRPTARSRAGGAEAGAVLGGGRGCLRRAARGGRANPAEGLQCCPQGPICPGGRFRIGRTAVQSPSVTSLANPCATVANETGVSRPEGDES
jgi:hypothetical protein